VGGDLAAQPQEVTLGDGLSVVGLDDPDDAALDVLLDALSDAPLEDEDAVEVTFGAGVVDADELGDVLQDGGGVALVEVEELGAELVGAELVGAELVCAELLGFELLGRELLELDAGALLPDR